MQLHVEDKRRSRMPDRRLVDIKSGLGIAGRQLAAWNVFVETFVTVQDMLDDVEREGASKLSDHAPSLLDLLRVQKARLATQLEATRLLNAITESLYHSLSERQRVRADRLLPLLCNELGLSAGVPHRRPH